MNVPANKFENLVDNKHLDLLYQKVSSYVEQARQTVKTTVDHEMVKAYWLIGRDIVEEEQKGEEKAQYGRALLKGLSAKLTQRYKRGFSVDILERARRFFIIYQLDSEVQKSATLSRKSELPQILPNLSWSHYVELIKIPRLEAREFYALEANKNNWNVREMRRQIATLLFDRLSKSKDKEGLLALVKKGHEINAPQDAFKDPMVLEFLGLPDSSRIIESDVKRALVNNMQQFLLELGKGFAFMGKEKRLTLDGKHFYADLVFYHTILKCYVVIDMKMDELSHYDLGQMLLYVNYYDQEIKMENDNPTIGLILCTQKSDTIVKYTLGEKAKQIFASKYQFHLPTEEQLEAELKRELEEIKSQKNDDELPANN